MGAKKHRTWLILSHCFNMDGRAASQTITDRLPYLTRASVRPVVISAPTGKQDRAFPHYRVFSPAPSGIVFEGRRIVENRMGGGWPGEIVKAMVTVFCFPFLILEKLIINLDSHWSWFITAGLKGGILIRRYKPELIYSTAGPSSSHLAGLLVKKVFGLPWIAEIHDPLVHETGWENYQRALFNRWLERKIFSCADAVIYFTDAACYHARQRTGIQGNSHVLRPGAAPPGPCASSYQKRSKIHLGHFGSLAPNRNLAGVISSMHRLFQKDPRLRELLVLDVYGTDLDRRSRKQVEALELGHSVISHGRLEFDPGTGKSGRQQVFEEMVRCDLLILLHGGPGISGEYIPSKVYEYLLTERPIVAVTDGTCELGGLLARMGHQVVEPEPEENLDKTLADFIRQWEQNGIEPVQGDSGFTVEKTVSKLLEIADACLGNSRS